MEVEVVQLTKKKQHVGCSVVVAEAVAVAEAVVVAEAVAVAEAVG